jgi:hypothetical protein
MVQGGARFRYRDGPARGRGRGRLAAGYKGVSGWDRLRVCFFPADPTAGRGLGISTWIASVERWDVIGTEG